ncbi:hypothetical protein Q8A73_008302 [Channa argus]|nr:hypothetical protein Q8A73_008302 [Channa argus]
MCQSPDTLLAAESIASVGQMRSRLLPSGLAGNQECPPSPPPHPPSFPNGSYQTHQEICDRTILKTMRRLPPTSPETKRSFAKASGSGGEAGQAAEYVPIQSPSTQPPFPSNHHPRLFIIGSPTHNQT